MSAPLSGDVTPVQLLCDSEQGSVPAALLCVLSAVIDAARDAGTGGGAGRAGREDVWLWMYLPYTVHLECFFILSMITPLS